jgi:AcrR family transcriptional regulator
MPSQLSKPAPLKPAPEKVSAARAKATTKAHRGRPRSDAAVSHAAILDAVYELLQEKSARDLTMDAVARRAKVGRPTLYKWWPSKAALVLAMFHERIANAPVAPATGTAEAAIRSNVRALIRAFNGLFGKVMADLIAEGQSEPEVLHELYEQHMRERRAASVARIEQAKAAGEFKLETDAELLIDSIIGPIYLRMLLRYAPLTESYGEELVDQVLRGVRACPTTKAT